MAFLLPLGFDCALRDTCSRVVVTGGVRFYQLWCLNDAQLELRAPNCAEKKSPYHQHHHQPEPLIVDRMNT